MISDMDVMRSAATMLKQHGDNAPMACEQIAEKWAGRGDEAAAENWRRIMEAAGALQTEGPGGAN